LINLPAPTFNLWSEPWLSVERPSGQLRTLSLEQTLLQAEKIHALYDPSPLIVVGIHRLLVAILQSSYAPQHIPDLLQIWRDERFLPDKIAAFGAQYTDRFDLFAEEVPFYQTADLPLQPAKGNKAKPVGYLLQEQPAGTAVTHYNHSYDKKCIFCSHCAAKGLLTMPAFASSGGAGIKPSINGVPPIYVLPGGKTLFHSLAASLTSPKFQPMNWVPNRAWWERPSPTIVEKKGEVLEVGYLDGLTFPARRIRLHPIHMNSPCSRCGTQTSWGVQTMVYEMGESRPKDAPFWRDPFAAYRMPKDENSPPLPIRPVAGRALWREFAGLFLPTQEEGGKSSRRPSVVEQIEYVRRKDKSAVPFQSNIPLRVIGLRTDMKMKIFEWEESGFLVPPHLLSDYEISQNIQDGIEFARWCDNSIKGTLHQYFGGGGKSERYKSLKQQMSQTYWQHLGIYFYDYIKGYTDETDVEILFQKWLDTVIKEALAAFRKTITMLPSTGAIPVPPKVKRYKNGKRQELRMIRLREDALNDCHKFIKGYRNKRHPQSEEISDESTS